MFSIPQLIQIQEGSILKKYAQVYFESSDLAIPDDYLYDPKNSIFGIYWKKELIGGFILGNSIDFRTIQVFAKSGHHEAIYHKLETPSLYTEITCFWIKQNFRTRTSLNFFTWLSMAYALKRYGNKYFLFGTCSRSLARLYGITSKSIMLHRDFIGKKPTFIFRAKRSSCITGILEIVWFKLKRAMKISAVAKSFFKSLVNKTNIFYKNSNQ